MVIRRAETHGQPTSALRRPILSDKPTAECPARQTVQNAEGAARVARRMGFGNDSEAARAIPGRGFQRGRRTVRRPRSQRVQKTLPKLARQVADFTMQFAASWPFNNQMFFES